MRFYAMMDTDEIIYLGDWGDEAYGDAFDRASEVAETRGAYHWVLDEAGLAKLLRTGRNVALAPRRGQPGRSRSGADEFVALLSTQYELCMSADDEFSYIRLIDARRVPGDQEIVYWDAKEFEDIGSALPALFGAIQRAVFCWGFDDIGVKSEYV